MPTIWTQDDDCASDGQKEIVTYTQEGLGWELVEGQEPTSSMCNLDSLLLQTLSPLQVKGDFYFFLGYSFYLCCVNLSSPNVWGTWRLFLFQSCSGVLQSPTGADDFSLTDRMICSVLLAAYIAQSLITT